eukprot:480489_1
MANHIVLLAIIRSFHFESFLKESEASIFICITLSLIDLVVCNGKSYCFIGDLIGNGTCGCLFGEHIRLFRTTIQSYFFSIITFCLIKMHKYFPLFLSDNITSYYFTIITQETNH